VWIHISGSCQPAKCRYNPSISNSIASSCINTRHGSRCHVSCKSGYYRYGNAPLCWLGYWRDVPTCKELSCASNPPILNLAAHINCAGTSSKSYCRIACKSGFTPSSSSAYCRRGSWVSTPSCTETKCTSDMNIANSSKYL